MGGLLVKSLVSQGTECYYFASSDTLVFMRAITVIGAVILVGFLMSRCSTPSLTTPQAQADDHTAKAEFPVPSKPEWVYESYEDKMTGDTGRYATLKSINTADLDFPYQGPQHAEIQVGDDNGVIFRVEKGQLNCNNTCTVLIKFDASKAEHYMFSLLSDKNLSIGSLDSKLGKRLYSAKHMTIRASFFQNGTFDFEFDVAGLKPFPKSAKKK